MTALADALGQLKSESTAEVFEKTKVLFKLGQIRDKLLSLKIPVKKRNPEDYVQLLKDITIKEFPQAYASKFT